MVDESRIAFNPAVELSYLTEQEQWDLLETFGYEEATPSHTQAIKMKEMSKAGTLTMDVILNHTVYQCYPQNCHHNGIRIWFYRRTEADAK